MFKKFLDGIKVVCFDLDGTIVNSEPLAAMAFEKVLKSVKPDAFMSDVYGPIGESSMSKWKRVFEKKYVQTEKNPIELNARNHEEFIKLFDEYDADCRPGFWDLIYKLKEINGLQIALATNTDKEPAMKELDKLGASQIFNYMVFGDEVKNKKPSPDIYLNIAKHFKIKPSEMLVFEDSVIGSTAAAAAGAKLIVVWDTVTPKDNFPEKTMAFMSDFDLLAPSLDYTVDEMLEMLRKADASGKTRHQQIQK